MNLKNFGGVILLLVLIMTACPPPASILPPASTPTAPPVTDGEYTLTLSSDQPGRTEPAGVISRAPGTAIGITAIPVPGYEFSRWVVKAGSGALFADPLAAATTVRLTGSSCTVHACFRRESGIVSTPLFRETFTAAESVASWSVYNGNGEIGIVESTSDAAGGKYLTIGNNDGNDQLLWIYNSSFAYDPEKLYEIRCRLRRTAGTGRIFIGIAGRNAADNGWVDAGGGGTLDLLNQHYFITRDTLPAGAWETCTAYFEGTAAGAVGKTNALITSPGAFHTNAVQFRPAILVNYQDASGSYDIDSLEINVVRSYTVFREEFVAADCLGRWKDYEVGGEITLNEEETALDGRIARLGNNNGSDTVWWITNDIIPFDSNELYQVSCRIRKQTGTGNMYIGVAGRILSDGNLINQNGAIHYGSQHYIVTYCFNPGNSDWLTITGYLKGSAELGTRTACPNPAAPGSLYNSATAFSPLVVVNYSAQPGITDIDSFTVKVIKDIGLLD